MSIVQYVVVRSDLGWPTGALIAQGCHASIAALVKSYAREETQEYVSQLDSMHKVVLAADSVQQVDELAAKLTAADVDHYAWREQPENLITALASAPGPKAKLAPFFRGFKLYK